MTSANGLMFLMNTWFTLIFFVVFLIPAVLVLIQMALLVLGATVGFLVDTFRHRRSKIADYLLKKSGFG